MLNNHKLIILISTGFFGFILWILYLANTGQQSLFFDLLVDVPYGDKISHLCLFGLLTLTANIAFKFKTILYLNRRIFLGTLLVIIFVIIEELSQHFIPTRTFDIQDLAADSLGIFIFSLFSYWLHTKLRLQNDN